MKAEMSSLSGKAATVALVGLLAAAFAASAQPERGADAGRQRPRLAQITGLMTYLERSWVAVAFELDVTDEQLTGLRAFYKAAWDTRQQALDQPAGDAAGRALALWEALDQVRSDIDAALTDVLTEEQLAQWEEIKEAQQRPLTQGWWRRAPQR
jgi:hypothetical protein